MSDRVRGHRIVLRLGAKLIVGDIDTSYKVAAEFDEILTKASAGTKELDLADCNEEFSVSGLMNLKETGEATTHVDITDIRPYVRAGTQLAFSYGIHEAGKPVVTGNLVITNCDESSNAKDNAVASISCRVVGTPAEGVVAIVLTPDAATHDSTAGDHDLALNATPDGIDWTATENDTGDGVDWFSCPASGSGDLDPFTVTFLENTGAARSATITISDDASEADDEVITVDQSAP